MRKLAKQDICIDKCMLSVICPAVRLLKSLRLGHPQSPVIANGAWYQISPWALMWDDEYYYLVAYDAQDNMIKHYRVDKMIKISVVDEKRIQALFPVLNMPLTPRRSTGRSREPKDTGKSRRRKSGRSAGQQSFV